MSLIYYARSHHTSRVRKLMFSTPVDAKNFDSKCYYKYTGFKYSVLLEGVKDVNHSKEDVILKKHKDPILEENKCWRELTTTWML